MASSGSLREFIADIEGIRNYVTLLFDLAEGQEGNAAFLGSTEEAKGHLLAAGELLKTYCVYLDKANGN